jgi:hypothetical protein
MLALRCKRFFDSVRPGDLKCKDVDLSWEVDDPLIELFMLGVAIENFQFFNTLFEKHSQRDLHGFFSFCQPLVNRRVFGNDDRLGERNTFTFTRVHASQVVTIVIVVQGRDACEHLREVPLHVFDHFGVANDFKQVFITHEVKSGKIRALFL